MSSRNRIRCAVCVEELRAGACKHRDVRRAEFRMQRQPRPGESPHYYACEDHKKAIETKIAAMLDERIAARKVAAVTTEVP